MRFGTRKDLWLQPAERCALLPAVLGCPARCSTLPFPKHLSGREAVLPPLKGDPEPKMRPKMGAIPGAPTTVWEHWLSGMLNCVPRCILLITNGKWSGDGWPVGHFLPQPGLCHSS